MIEPSRVKMISQSPAGTQAVGKAVAEISRLGDVIALTGELGAGKTVFVRGLAEALGADPRAVSSPTFVLMQEYDATPPVLHIDAYRIESLTELETTGWTETLAAESISVIEWAERIAGELPADRLVVRLSHLGDSRRSIELIGLGDWAERLASLRRLHGEQALAAEPDAAGVCPVCGNATPADSPAPPFCSDRCKTVDLGRWLSGAYRLGRDIDWESDDLAAMEQQLGESDESDRSA
jgi:tRNA threonylcarbamoyladenosine biosynthesis protein TsaE